MDNNTSIATPVVTATPVVKVRAKRGKGKVAKAKKADAKMVGDKIDLIAWLDERDSKGVRKNVSDDCAAELSKGKQTVTDGRVMGITSENWTLNVEVAQRKVPANKDGILYAQEYASLLPLTADAAMTQVAGKLDATFDKDGSELPSVVKYFRQGFGMLARNNAGSAIATLIEGPEKARERTIVSMMKANGWDRAMADAMYAQLLQFAAAQKKA